MQRREHSHGDAVREAMAFAALRGQELRFVHLDFAEHAAGLVGADDLRAGVAGDDFGACEVIEMAVADEDEVGTIAFVVSSTTGAKKSALSPSMKYSNQPDESITFIDGLPGPDRYHCSYPSESRALPLCCAPVQLPGGCHTRSGVLFARV